MVNTSPLPSSKSSAVLRDVRSTHFFDTSSIDSEGSTPTPLQPSQPQSNGNDKASSSKRKPSHQLNGGPKKRSARVEDSEEARSRRREIADKLFEGRQELPFYQGRRMIMEEIMAHDTTIILGETGCGKSTQLPQLLRSHSISLDHFGAHNAHASRFARAPRIAVTQPRRLPTIALAIRVAAEMGCQVGGEVGYSVRFEDNSSRRTGLRYITEGVLMRELANGDNRPGPSSETREEGGLNLLLRYDVIIVDEAHERTLNTDFLCGALKKIQRIRKRLAAEGKRANGFGDEASKGKGKEKEAVRELKIVIMSATLDPSKFQRFFETGREALLVKGRTHDIQTRHVHEAVDDFIESAARMVTQIHKDPKAVGHVLVFMPGSEEIENCVELLRRVSRELPPKSKQLDVLALYSALAPAAQARIFAPTAPDIRRIIVATNIAETSITIPGIAYVVDTGYKKEKEYIFRTSGGLLILLHPCSLDVSLAIEHLAKKSISKAAAWQRTGRAGREAFDKLEEYDVPEIQRCNLASAVLQLVAMGQNPFDFDYIDNPGQDPIKAAFQTLAGLGALDSPTLITPLGREMLHYPLDPEHARILIASFTLGCASEIIDIVSLVVSGPVWIDRASDRVSAATARAKFIHRDGDHLTGLNVFRAFLAANESRGRWCRENHVNAKTLSAAMRVRDQLRELATRNGKDWNVSCGSETEVVVRCLLQGLFMNTAIIQADGTYKQTAGSLLVKIHPSSVLMSKKVPAILYDELTITSSFYSRNVSAFEQHWLSEVPWFRQVGRAVEEAAPKSHL